MTHLTVDEIIEFVSIKTLDRDSINLAAHVNGHISKCNECLKKVRAFKTVHEGFMNLITDDSFSDYVKKLELDKEIQLDKTQKNINR